MKRGNVCGVSVRFFSVLPDSVAAEELGRSYRSYNLRLLENLIRMRVRKIAVLSTKSQTLRAKKIHKKYSLRLHRGLTHCH